MLQSPMWRPFFWCGLVRVSLAFVPGAEARAADVAPTPATGATPPTQSPPPASSRAAAPETPGSRLVGMLNRSLITVGSDAYTTLDGRLLLALWNALAARAVPMVTNFEADPSSWARSPADEQGASRSKRISRLAPDARRLLFILFVWDESRRLGLFVPSDKALSDVADEITNSDFATASPVDVRRFWSELGVSGQRVYLNMILRAKTYLKVRGDLDTNPRLSDLVWFWHGLSEP